MRSVGLLPALSSLRLDVPSSATASVQNKRPTTHTAVGMMMEDDSEITDVDDDDFTDVDDDDFTLSDAKEPSYGEQVEMFHSAVERAIEDEDDAKRLREVWKSTIPEKFRSRYPVNVGLFNRIMRHMVETQKKLGPADGDIKNMFNDFKYTMYTMYTSNDAMKDYVARVLHSRVDNAWAEALALGLKNNYEKRRKANKDLWSEVSRYMIPQRTIKRYKGDLEEDWADLELEDIRFVVDLFYDWLGPAFSGATFDVQDVGKTSLLLAPKRTTFVDGAMSAYNDMTDIEKQTAKKQLRKLVAQYAKILDDDRDSSMLGIELASLALWKKSFALIAQPQFDAAERLRLARLTKLDEDVDYVRSELNRTRLIITTKTEYYFDVPSTMAQAPVTIAEAVEQQQSVLGQIKKQFSKLHEDVALVLDGSPGAHKLHSSLALAEQLHGSTVLSVKPIVWPQATVDEKLMELMNGVELDEITGMLVLVKPAFEALLRAVEVIKGVLDSHAKAVVELTKKILNNSLSLNTFVVVDSNTSETLHLTKEEVQRLNLRAQQTRLKLANPATPGIVSNEWTNQLLGYHFLINEKYVTESFLFSSPLFDGRTTRKQREREEEKEKKRARSEQLPPQTY